MSITACVLAAIAVGTAVTSLEEAALEFSTMFGPMTNFEGEVVAARHERDLEGRRWDKALDAVAR